MLLDSRQIIFNNLPTTDFLSALFARPNDDNTERRTIKKKQKHTILWSLFDTSVKNTCSEASSILHYINNSRIKMKKKHPCIDITSRLKVQQATCTICIRQKIYWNWLMASPFLFFLFSTTLCRYRHWQCVLICLGKCWMHSQRYGMHTHTNAIARRPLSRVRKRMQMRSTPLNGRRTQILLCSIDLYVGVYLRLWSLLHAIVKTNIRTSRKHTLITPLWWWFLCCDFVRSSIVWLCIVQLNMHSEINLN